MQEQLSINGKVSPPRNILSDLFVIVSYGFCLLKEGNKYDSLQIRVLNGTSPDHEIEDPQEMFPSQKIYDEPKGLEDLTMILKFKPNKINEGNIFICLTLFRIYELCKRCSND